MASLHLESNDLPTVPLTWLADRGGVMWSFSSSVVLLDYANGLKSISPVDEKTGHISVIDGIGFSTCHCGIAELAITSD